VSPTTVQSAFWPYFTVISQQPNSFCSQSAATTNVCIYININWFCPSDKLERLVASWPSSDPLLTLSWTTPDPLPPVSGVAASSETFSFHFLSDDLLWGTFIYLCKLFLFFFLLFFRLLIWFLSAFYFLLAPVGVLVCTSRIRPAVDAADFISGYFSYLKFLPSRWLIAKQLPAAFALTWGN